MNNIDIFYCLKYLSINKCPSLDIDNNIINNNNNIYNNNINNNNINNNNININNNNNKIIIITIII